MSRSKAEETRIVRAYTRGATLLELGEDYATSKTTIRNILKRHNVQRRKKKFRGAPAKRAITLYRGGMTAPEIAKKLGVSSTAVYRVLHEANVKPADLMRLGERGKANRRFTDEQEIVIANKYKNGESLATIGREHNVNLVTIRNVLLRQKVERRRRGNVFRSFTDKEVKRIAKMWSKGMSQAAIGKMYKTNQTVISRVLRSHGYTSGKRYADEERHGNWHGGRYVTKSGYVFVKVKHDSPYKNMANASGYVMEHRLVMAKHLKRSLQQYETVHHINGNETDNRFKNLQLRSGRHGKGAVYKCADCGSHNIVTERIAVH